MLIGSSGVLLPEFVAAGSTATQGTNVIGVPSGIVAGDLLIIIATSGGSETLTTTTGWTQIVNSPTAGSIRIIAWTKISGASEVSNSFTAPQARLRAAMFAYRNVAAVNVNSTPTTATSTSAATLSVTTTQSNCLVLGLATTSATASYTYPTIVNQRYNVACNGTINGLVLWDEVQSAAGASTVRTATLNTSTAWYTYTAAFK